LKNHKFLKEKKRNYTIIVCIPGFILWFLTILFLIIYYCKEKEVKEILKNIIQDYRKKLKCANDNNIEILSKKLRIRTKYYEHCNFKLILQGNIILGIPFLLKIFVFKKAKYKTFLFISSFTLMLLMFLISLIKLIIFKIKKYFQTKLNNLKYLEAKFPGNSHLGKIKQNINNYSSYYSENIMNITFLFTKLFIGILFVVYFTQIGEKLDDSIKGCSWIILFIPIYILFAPILAFIIIHCISLFKYFKFKFLLFLTLIPCVFAIYANGILIPMILENRTGIPYYYIPIIFSIGTIFLAIHLKLISNKIGQIK
jgi:hypothetical protein